jgi:hypothetical protein
MRALALGEIVLQIKLNPWLGAMASLLTLAACSGGAPASEPQRQSATPSPEARCDAAAAQNLVGQPFGDDALARVQAAAGAREARFLRPDSVITKEFKVGRVNVVVDAHQRIVRVYCG